MLLYDGVSLSEMKLILDYVCSKCYIWQSQEALFEQVGECHFVLDDARISVTFYAIRGNHGKS